MKKGLTAAIAAGAMLLATACSGTSGSGSSAKPQGGRTAFKGTNLHVLLSQGYEVNAVKKFLPQFEKATGIKVTLEVDDESTALQKFSLDQSGGTGTYDVVDAQFWNVPKEVKSGWLEPLNQYISKAPDKWLNMQDIPQGALNSFKVGGKIYALPETIAGGELFYRKDIFAKYGLSAPKTTADVLKDAATLKQKDPSITPFVGRGAANFSAAASELGWAAGYGAKLLNGKTVEADSPAMQRGVSDYVKLMTTYGPPGGASIDFTQAGELFRTGKAAMMFDMSGFGTVFEDPTQSKVVGKVGYTIPTGPAGRPVQWLYNEGYGISSQSKNKNAAWLFVQWRVSRDLTSQELAKLGRTDIPNMHEMNSGTYKQVVAKAHQQAFAALLPTVWKDANASYFPNVPQWSQIGDSFGAHVSAAIAGSTSVPSALSAAQNEIKQDMASS